MHKKIITAAAFALSFSVQAEWSLVGENEDVDKHYIDFSTIKKTDHGYRAWLLVELTANKAEGVRSYNSVWEYNCDEDTYRILRMSSFSGQMGRGKLVRSFRRPTEWDYAAPGSIGKIQLEAVCNPPHRRRSSGGLDRSNPKNP